MSNARNQKLKGTLQVVHNCTSRIKHVADCMGKSGDPVQQEMATHLLLDISTIMMALESLDESNTGRPVRSSPS